MPATKRILHRANASNKRMRRTPMYLKPETKYFNQAIPTASVASRTINCCRMDAGTGVSERIGRKITLKSVSYLGIAPSGTSCRAILYVPKDQSDELVLSGYTAGVDNDKFWVISDKLWDANGSLTAFQHSHRFPMGMGVEYGGPLGDDINRNGVRLLLATDGVTTINGHTKIWYADN